MINILKGRWGFDSNLIIYSLIKTSPFYPKITEFMKLYKKSEFQLFTANQNILEAENVFVSVYRMHISKAVSAVMNFINDFDISIVSPLPVTIHQFHSHIMRTKKIEIKNIFDRYLAFTYLNNDIDQLLTNNEKDFMHIPGLKVINPFKQV